MHLQQQVAEYSSGCPAAPHSSTSVTMETTASGSVTGPSESSTQHPSKVSWEFGISAESDGDQPRASRSAEFLMMSRVFGFFGRRAAVFAERDRT